jgi:HEAT repeat protein
LNAEWIAHEGTRHDVRSQAARGLSSFLSDEAAEILLRGFGSSNSSIRAICMQGLDHIEGLRQRTARWEKLKMEQPSKESALLELLDMLDDENLEVRTQAIRGIATFGAIEYLPTLIRLLKDPEEEIVKAARIAIDTLSATAGKKREG